MAAAWRARAATLPGASKVDKFVRDTGKMVALPLEAIRLLPTRRFPVAEFFDQCMFLVRVCTVPLILIAFPFGIIIAVLIGSLLQQLGASSVLGAGVSYAMVQYVGPLTSAVLIAGAGGSAICSDLGSRRIRDEISAMEVMGVNPIHRLVLPRLLASTVVGVVLSVVVTVAGIFGGYLMGVAFVHTTQSSFMATFNVLTQMADLYYSLIKAACFGFLAAAVAAYKGLNCDGGAKGVGAAVNQSVVLTIILLFFVNFIFTAVYQNFVPQRLT